jgi:hypothetical protein
VLHQQVERTKVIEKAIRINNQEVFYRLNLIEEINRWIIWINKMSKLKNRIIKQLKFASLLKKQKSNCLKYNPHKSKIIAINQNSIVK